jgi:hypothetical protein
MATTDTTAWDKNITELRDKVPQQFTNPISRDIATHCVSLLQTAMNIERNYANQPQGGAGKEDYRTTSR